LRQQPNKRGRRERRTREGGIKKLSIIRELISEQRHINFLERSDRQENS
jgi:hypothetical protein